MGPGHSVELDEQVTRSNKPKVAIRTKSDHAGPAIRLNDSVPAIRCSDQPLLFVWMARSFCSFEWPGPVIHFSDQPLLFAWMTRSFCSLEWPCSPAIRLCDQPLFLIWMTRSFYSFEWPVSVSRLNEQVIILVWVAMQPLQFVWVTSSVYLWTASSCYLLFGWVTTHLLPFVWITSCNYSFEWPYSAFRLNEQLLLSAIRLSAHSASAFCLNGQLLLIISEPIFCYSLE